jgi:hypothetical protein
VGNGAPWTCTARPSGMDMWRGYTSRRHRRRSGTGLILMHLKRTAKVWRTERKEGMNPVQSHWRSVVHTGPIQVALVPARGQGIPCDDVGGTLLGFHELPVRLLPDPAEDCHGVPEEGNAVVTGDSPV